MRVLLTTTSFQDTPGSFHDLLASKGYEIIRQRGPLPEPRMLELVGDIDALLCGDDAITRAVLQKSLPRLKVVSKYGIGLDKIDMTAATELKIPVCFTPGVNHTAVAEQTFLLLLALEKNFLFAVDATRQGQWKRKTGHEIMGKTLGIIGLGRIGREVALRARAFGLTIIGYDIHWDEAFAAEQGVRRAATVNEICAAADYLSLHTNLTPETRNLINAASLAKMKKGVIILNCARGEIVNTKDMVAALQSGRVGGYGADVLDQEPPPPDHPLLRQPNCIVTPHVSSRTFESVQRQATMSVQNLLAVLDGQKPLAQANIF
ncbi:MAG: phosphoglycerate dehydrogenase [Verrucomicrobiota bacterium]|jgi:D-3-phosphoglycerate dehydrogenase